jgi:hypothetical protein
MKKMFPVLLAATALWAADPPYAGKWKMNEAKSDFREMTFTLTDLPSGEKQMEMMGQSFKFKMDGKDYPALFGQTSAWRQIDPHTWESIDRLNGKVVTTSTISLSADGKTMTQKSQTPKPGGGSMDETMMFQRVSGGTDLAGKWKTTKLQSSSPETMELTPSGEDGLKLSVPELQLVCDARLDGKDYPCTGPTITGWTMSIKKSGPRSLEVLEKQNGKAAFQYTMTASADGKTLTSVGNPPGVNEKVKVVYDRQ